MAESKGILFEIQISEPNLKKLLNKSVDIFLLNKDKVDKKDILGKQKLIYFFASLLHSCENSSGNIFLFNYKNEKLFCAYVLNYYTNTILKPFEKLLTLFAKNKDIVSKDIAIITTIYPDVEFGYCIEKGSLTKISSNKINEKVVNQLLDKMWSYRIKNDFPEPEKALRKRNYFYKPLKPAYTRFLKQIEEIEKPEKIAVATKKNPYHLFDSFFSYDNKVFEISASGNKVLEVEKADPLTFRSVTSRGIPSLFADKTFAFEKKQEFEKVYPFKLIKKYYKIINGVDGSTFNYIKDRWDSVFWNDKNRVFVYAEKLISVENADTETFEYLNFRFGKDKNNIYYLDQIIDIDNKNYTLNINGFIYDDKNIYHYENKLNLEAKTFKVIKYESKENPFIGVFVLEDKNGQYEYDYPQKTKIKKIKST